MYAMLMRHIKGVKEVGVEAWMLLPPTSVNVADLHKIYFVPVPSHNVGQRSRRVEKNIFATAKRMLPWVSFGEYCYLEKQRPITKDRCSFPADVYWEYVIGIVRFESFASIVLADYYHQLLAPP